MANLYNVDSPITREERNNLNNTFQDIQSEIGKVVIKTGQIKDEVEGSLGGLQNQINELVVNGDSSPEAAQARVSSDGEVFSTLKERLDSEYETNQNDISDLSLVTKILDIVNDGTDDISTKLLNYSNTVDELTLYFPPGKYKWDNNIILKNKKIKLIGDNATIEHYASGSVLGIGDETNKTTKSFVIQGLDFVNKKPKPVSGGSGVSALVLRDCEDSTIRDVNIYDAEQYGIQLRVSNGTLGNVTIDNVKVLRCIGTLSTTTSIALETRAEGASGRIKDLKISNSTFEVAVSYEAEGGSMVTPTLSNACKIQGADNVDISNTTFIGGKENGTLSFIYDVKNVNMVNVKTIGNQMISNALTISSSPDLILKATNCDFGPLNFVQSIGINGTVKSANFDNCVLSRLTKVSGDPSNFFFNGCTFNLNNGVNEYTLNIPFKDSQFNNCKIINGTRNIIIPAGSNNLRLFNVTGCDILEISSNDCTVDSGEYGSIRGNGSSTLCNVKNSKATSADRPLRMMSSTVSDWVIEGCEIQATQGGSNPIALIQGTNMKIERCSFRQLDKNNTLNNVVVFSNSTNCKCIEKENVFDVNKTGSNVNQVSSTGLLIYNPGDTFYTSSTARMWNGTSFINLQTI